MTKKLLSRLIVVIVLLAVSAVILIGALINSDTASPRKPEPMKENKCPTVFSNDFYGEINGKREKIVRVVFDRCYIEVNKSDKIGGISVKINGFCQDNNCFLETRFNYSGSNNVVRAKNLFSPTTEYYSVETHYYMMPGFQWSSSGRYTYIGKGIIGDTDKIKNNPE